MTWRGRNIYLLGLPGAGKSAVGRELAALLAGSGYRFVDLDRAVEERASRTIPEIFRDCGEAAFRKLETEALLEVSTGTFEQSPAVVATGGGGVLSPLNRTIMRGSGVQVWIDVTVRDAAAKIWADMQRGAERPLLRSTGPAELAEKLRLLHDARRPYYEQATLHFVTKSPRGDERTPFELAEELRKALDEMSLHVALKPRFRTLMARSSRADYAIQIGNGIAAGELAQYVRDHRITSVVVISDSNVAPLHAPAVVSSLKGALRGVDVQEMTLPAGESSKSWEQLSELLRVLHKAELTRSRGLVVALGGGMISDIAGLAASLYKRGVALVHVPTSLLAQVDAAIGGKTAIDAFGVKNAIGTFYPPYRVIVDPVFLKTLPLRELHSGLAEVVKYALIDDTALWSELADSLERLTRGSDATYVPIIYRSVFDKVRYVEQDEFEIAPGVRELLNFGHTFGHGLEAATNFGVFLHGEAVALGMRTAAWLSWQLGYLSEPTYREIDNVLAKLPIAVTAQVSSDAVLASMRQDKKRSNEHRLILLRNIGEAFATEVREEDVRKGIDHMLALL